MLKIYIISLNDVYERKLKNEFEEIQKNKIKFFICKNIVKLTNIETNLMKIHFFGSDYYLS